MFRHSKVKHICQKPMAFLLETDRFHRAVSKLSLIDTVSRFINQ